MNINPEWIEWKGGDRPVGENDRVVVTLRDGSTRLGIGRMLSWGWDYDHGGDILAYCLLDIEPYKSQPKWTVEEGNQGYTWIKYKGSAAMTATSLKSAQDVCDALNNAGVKL